jgi:hypothetical protein
MKTKKNKLTNILKIGILFFGISLLLFNCEKDNEINEFHNVSANNKLDYTLEKIGYSELLTDQEIQKSLPNIKHRFSKSKKLKTLNKKTTQISEHFSIIKDSIHKIITKDAITWTFKVETPVLKNSDFENFLVKKHNEEFSYFLVSYQKDLETVYKKATSYPISKKFLNLDNLNLARRGEFIQDFGESTGGGTGCEGIITHQPCSNGDSYIHGPEPYRSGGYCSGSITILDFSHCFITGTSNNANSNTNNNVSNNTLYNSGGGTSSNGGSTITSPVTLECDNCSESLISKLNLTDQNQINWVNDSNNSEEVDAIFNFSITNNWSNEALKASNLTIASLTKNKLQGPYDANFFNTINPYIDADLTDPYLQAIFMAHFSAQCAVLELENPDWSSTRIYWEASKEMIHIALDLGGMVPVVGEVCDLTNGIIYTIEGDGVNATLSFAATIPFAGWAATRTKYAIKASSLNTKVRLTWKVLADGSVYFGSSSSKLRKVLGITNATLQAHHLIPWAKRTKNLVQKAAKSKHAFHMNEALNGIAVATWRNQPNHNLYNNRVQAFFDALPSNLTPDEAYNSLTEIMTTIRNVIVNNPNTHLNDLIF